MDIKETYSLWKKGSNDICIIQRYIYPFNNCPVRARVEFSVADSCFTKRVTRAPSYVFNYDLYDNDRFLATGELGEENKIVEANLQVQMQTLKAIIESEDARNQVVSFIIADFVQDSDESWFFISLISYKYETMLPKIASHAKKTRVLSRVQKSEASLVKNGKLSKSVSSSTVLKDLLTQEALRDISAGYL